MSGTGDRVTEDSDPERVLSQALRAMAGGRPVPNPSATGSGGINSRDDGGGGSPRRGGRLTIAQILLIAAIVGLVIGMGLGLIIIARG